MIDQSKLYKELCQCCHPGHNDRRYTKVSQSWLDAICGSMACARPIHGQCRKRGHANSIQFLQNAIIQANGLRYAVEEKIFSQWLHEAICFNSPGHTDLCAALDNQSHARRSALSNLRGRLLNVALKRFFAIIVIKGAQ